jgi:hypothetical protein
VSVADAGASVGNAEVSVGDAQVSVGNADVSVENADVSVGDADVSVWLYERPKFRRRFPRILVMTSTSLTVPQASNEKLPILIAHGGTVFAWFLAPLLV